MSRTLAAAAAALAALVLLPAPAHAERWSGDDATGDAQAWQSSAAADDWCAESTPVTSDATPGQDITSLAVRHQPGRVVLRLRYAGAASTTHRSFWFHVRSGRDALAVDVHQRRDGGRWRLDVSDEPDWSESPVDTDGDGVTDCTVWFGAALGWSCRDYDVDVAEQDVTVSVPRVCLNFPRWVEVGAESWGQAGDDISIGDEWGTTEPSTDPTVVTYGDRVRVSHGHSGSPSNRSLRASSATETRRSFVTSRTGFPIGTTAARAY